MNKVCIFGSGQAGAMALTWLPTGNEVLSFIDNKKEKQGLFLKDKPVESLGDALKREPDEILIAVLNKEAAEEIKKQIASSGFTGEVSDVNELRRRIDIRLSAIRLSSGGRIFIHDYTSLQFDGVKKAVDKYCAENKLFVLPLMDMHGSAVLIRQ